MKQKIITSTTVALLILGSSMDAMAQTRRSNVSGLISTGRANMAKQTSVGIAAAHKNFSDALKAAPNNAEANLLFAATLILREHATRDFHNELHAIGVGVIDPNPYDYEFSYAVDRQGRFAPFRYSDTKRTISFLTKKGAVRANALSCLRRITDTKFRMVLTASETSLLEVAVDYGDVLFLRAILLTAGAFQDMALAHNLEAEYFGIYRFVLEPDLNLQKALKAYPDAFNLTAQSRRRATARTQLLQANKEAQAAFAFIKNSRIPGIAPNLFEVEDGASAQETARVLQTLAKSLSGVDTLPILGKKEEGSLEGRKLNLSPLFDSRTSPRSLFPDSFDRGYIRPGSWKDRTLGGIFPDFTSDDLDMLALDLGILQNTTLEPYTFSNFAGLPGMEGYEAPDGTALFGDIGGLAVDSVGNVYVADNHNHVIQKITPAGEVIDFVGKRWITWQEQFQLLNEHWHQNLEWDSPTGIFYTFGGGMAFDVVGNFYFTADGLIWKFTPSGQLIEIAGSWEGEVRNGKGKDARFVWPTHIAVGKSGTIYICDASAVRKVDSEGNVSTLAGKLGAWWEGSEGYVDGIGENARFDSLGGIAVDSSENIYVMEFDNRVLRKISPSGATTTFVGKLRSEERDFKPFDSVGLRAIFGELTWTGGLAIDSARNLYLVDSELVRKISPQGKVTTIGGKFGSTGRRDGVGEEALFGDPRSTGIAVDKVGRVYVSDDTTIRRGTKQ
jgi:DNA-binding beta-propeller fold protein YncE